MSLLILAAVAVLAALAGWRIIRVRSGRRAQPEGWRMRVLALAFLVGPPIALQGLTAQAGSGQLDRTASVLLYVGAVVVLRLLMWVIAALVARFAPVNWRPILLLALVGAETSDLVPFDPPMTGTLTAGVTLVDVRNAAFPRGSAFMHQVELPGFRSTWEALDAATHSLEALIAEAGRLRTGVAQRATETATDARARLDTLRREAAVRGQAWAT